MHWIIDTILIGAAAYLIWAIETARGQIAGARRQIAALAAMLDDQRARLDSIDETSDSMARQFNTPGTRHWTRPDDPY